MLDVLIIGAGPAGAVAAGLLAKNGYSVRVLERQKFPRFSIGESLLAREILGERFVDHYVRTRDWEVRQYDRAVTDWELRRYFEAV